jgi:NTE family protein
VGAITALASAVEPYQFHRVAGTSAGAIVASMLASGYDAAEMKTVMTDLDFSQFEDEHGFVGEHLELLAEGLGLLLHEGLFLGQFLHDWIGQILAAKNVHTWGDLKDDDPGSSLPPAQRYKLIVIVSDISRGRMLRLPWDYEPELGVDPDTQPVADAVRASAGIPFFFRPLHITANQDVTHGQGHILGTDGGMLSNFPVAIFDRTDGKPPRWPTFGVKLSARQSLAQCNWNPNANSIELAKSLLGTMQTAHDQVYVDEASVASRTIFVDTTGYTATDFHLTAADKQTLFDNGQQAGEKFLGTWNWDKWQAGDYAT